MEEEEGEECAAVRRTTDLLSQAVGHMGGILLREEAIGVKQAALLAEALTELTSPDLFWRPGTSPGCRRAVVELLSVSLCALHKHQRLVKVMPRVIRAVAAEPVGQEKADAVVVAGGALDAHPALALSRSLLGGAGAERTDYKPPPMRVTRAVALYPLLEACAGPLSGATDVALEVLVRVIYGTGIGLAFVGDKASRLGVGGIGGGGSNEEEGVVEQVGDEGDIDGALATVAGAPGSGAGALPMNLAAGNKVRLLYEQPWTTCWVKSCVCSYAAATSPPAPQWC